MSIHYSHRPELAWINDEKCWEVLTEFSIVWVPEAPFTSIMFSIPKGFKTDLASLPGFVRMFNPANGHHLQAAIVHDFVYRTEWVGVTKPEGDQMFYDGMVHMGTPVYRAKYMFAGVKVFGGSSYVKRSR